MDEEKIKVLNEFNEEKEATILNELEINGNNYVVYSVSENEDEEGIYASKLVKDNFGNEMLTPIEDEEERAIVFDSVREFINDLD